MRSSESVVVDAFVSRGEARLWLRGLDGGVEVLRRGFEDYFLVEGSALGFLASLWDQGFSVGEVERRLIGGKTAILLRVSHGSRRLLLKALRVVEGAGFTSYDSDVNVVQKLFAGLGIVALRPYRRSGWLFMEGEDRVEPLPLVTVGLDLHVRGGFLSKAVVRGSGGERVFEGSESRVFEGLDAVLRELDPDVVAVNMPVKELRKLAIGIRRRHGWFRLGRGEGVLEGRIFVERGLLDGIGLAGLEERCRATGLSPTLAGMTSYGRLIDARQVYLLLRRGYAVPKARHRNVHVRTMLELHRGDRGGLIYQPVTGIYGNVAELDFESMFPNLIVRYNISYETVSLGGVAREPRGILVDVVEPLLERRLRFKHMARELSGDAKKFADQRQKELKMILVSSYGYSGNNYNRLGNPLTFEWINRLARRVMLGVYGLLREKGYTVIYGDTDSVFVYRDGASRSDYEGLAGEIAERYGMPIKVDKLFRFIAFPEAKTTRASPVKRYFGVTVEGEYVFKGVEAARSDYPPLVRGFQARLVETVLGVLEKSGVDGALSAAEELLRREVERLRSGLVPVEELLIEKTLRREKYRVKAMHVVAAQQAGVSGKGSKVCFMLAKHPKSSPHLRVRVPGTGTILPDYDAYEKLLVRAYETVVSSLVNVRVPSSYQRKAG